MRRASILFAAVIAVACGGSVENGGKGGSGGVTGGSGGVTGGSGGATGGFGGVTGGFGGATGGFGGVTGGFGGVGGIPVGGAGGVGGVCPDLEAKYQTVLGAAKSCSLFVNKIQCTELFPNTLTCPCPTYINPDNQLEQELYDLQNQWAASGCVVPCPAIACPIPQGSGCTPNGGGGDSASCQDYWPD